MAKTNTGIAWLDALLKNMKSSSSENETEDSDELESETSDNQRALASMQEELEAVGLYDQRIKASTDNRLKQILTHNQNEEKEHFARLLGWYRQQDNEVDMQLKKYAAHIIKQSR